MLLNIAVALADPGASGLNSGSCSEVPGSRKPAAAALPLEPAKVAGPPVTRASPRALSSLFRLIVHCRAINAGASPPLGTARQRQRRHLLRAVDLSLRQIARRLTAVRARLDL